MPIVATVLLFDLDGTLVRTGGAGRRALAQAFEEVVGRADACDGIALGGMTDRAIVRQGLGAVGRAWHPGDAAGEQVIDEILARYLRHLPEVLARTDGYEVLPGVRAVLDALDGRPNLAIGLGTGNIEPAARVKLAPGRLADRFPFGGFGSDAEDRAALLRAGRDRGAARLGRTADEVRTVVIGDTPRDVAAARAIGADCLGVGTGGHLPDDLIRLGAVHAVLDLTAPEVVDRWLLGGVGR